MTPSPRTPSTRLPSRLSSLCRHPLGSLQPPPAVPESQAFQRNPTRHALPRARSAQEPAPGESPPPVALGGKLPDSLVPLFMPQRGFQLPLSTRKQSSYSRPGEALREAESDKRSEGAQTPLPQLQEVTGCTGRGAPPLADGLPQRTLRRCWGSRVWPSFSAGAPSDPITPLLETHAERSTA